MPRISVITSLYKCHQYLDGYFDAVDKIVNKEECEFLLIFNDPTPKEESIVKKRIAGKNYFRYIKVDREPLYASWNRGVKLASSQFIANWNVDDVRLPDSLIRQVEALENNKKCAIAYGDTVNVLKYGETTGTVNHELEYSKSTRDRFKDSFFMSCFPMWRKSIHEEIGYFDEQFKLVGDFEFQIRVAYRYPFVKVDGILGYFFAGGGGARLSQQIKRHIVENNATYLRYGVYNKVDITYLGGRLQFNEDAVLFGEKYIPVKCYVPDIKLVRNSQKIKWVRNIFLKFPIDLLRYVKVNIFRIPTRND